MKKLLLSMAALALCIPAQVWAEKGTTDAIVKMTYVDKSNPDETFGEIEAGSKAISGFNKIVDGGRGYSVEFGNEGWGVNYITYLQVDASAIKGNIMNAYLTFEASGSTDSKRPTGWGVGYNNNFTWSSSMTYATAQTGIITLGGQKWTSTKSAETFEELSFDITEALKKADKGIATILVYETAAGGGYIKNPKVEVEWSTESVYKVTFAATNEGVTPTVTLDNKDVTLGTYLPNGTYKYTASASGYQDYNGEVYVDGANKNEEFTMEPLETWNFTVKNNVNSDVKTGSCLQGLSATVPYNRYIIAEDGTVWMKDATSKEYRSTITPDKNDYETTLEYTATDMKGVFFVEGEDIEGMSVVTKDNADIRCSNAAGGYAEEAVKVCTLKAGKYQVIIGVWGNAGATFVVKAGEEQVISADTKGWWYEETSEVLSLEADTEITFEGAVNGKPLDYVLIIDATSTAVEAIEAVKDGKWYNLHGVQVAEPTVKGLYIHNGKKVIVK